MILALVLALSATTAAAQDAPTPPVEAVRACVEAADRAPEAERACVGVAALACIDAGGAAETTLGMSSCYGAELAAWDALLNATYRDLTALSKAQTAADAEAGGAPVDLAALLRDAQRAWIGFRDADCARVAGYWGDGSMRRIAGAQCLLERTATRTLELVDARRVFENP